MQLSPRAPSHWGDHPSFRGVVAFRKDCNILWRDLNRDGREIKSVYITPLSTSDHVASCPQLTVGGAASLI